MSHLQPVRIDAVKRLSYFVALPLGLLGTLALFWLMQWLITPGDLIKKDAQAYNMIDFVRVKREPESPEQKKRLPPEPKQKPMPKMQTPEIATTAQQQPQPQAISADMPNLQHSTGFAKGPKLTMDAMRGDSELTPLVRINPQYPPRARRAGVEGYVKARLNVDVKGLVKSIEILESEPAGEFTKSVMRTLKRWKFKPKVVDGKPMEYSGTVTIEFKLEK